MKKLLLSATLILSAVAFGQVGINTTAPDATLEVKSKIGKTTSATNNLKLENGDSKELMTVKDNGEIHLPLVKENNDNSYMLSLNSAGIVEKTKSYRITDSKTKIADNSVDVKVAINEVFEKYIDLGLSTSVSVPAGKKWGVAVFYSVPVGTVLYTYTNANSNGSNDYVTITVDGKPYKFNTQFGGYWGVTFYSDKDGSLVEKPEASRKNGVPKRTGGPIQMSTIESNYFDVIDNTGSNTSKTVTYAAKGYLEHYDDSNTSFDAAGATVRFNLYGPSIPQNHNWGKASISYIAYELP